VGDLQCGRPDDDGALVCAHADSLRRRDLPYGPRVFHLVARRLVGGLQERQVGLQCGLPGVLVRVLDLDLDHLSVRRRLDPNLRDLEDQFRHVLDCRDHQIFCLEGGLRLVFLCHLHHALAE